jgi:protein-S-isoprenylcysteine O-methyltransferase Ste14
MMQSNSTSTTSPEIPGVAILPPVLYGGSFLAVLLLHWIWPLKIVRQPIAFWLGLVLSVSALSLGAWGRRTMHGASTNISPLKPAVSLVTSGPFRFSRNPLYVAITLLYVGFTMLLNSWWGVIMLAPVLMALHWGVVQREEQYLQLKFGEQYTEFRSRVRRYF